MTFTEPNQSEEMIGMKINHEPIEDPYATHSEMCTPENPCITCGKNTMYEDTCKFLDCKYGHYKSNAPYGCKACQSKAEESDIGI